MTRRAGGTRSPAIAAPLPPPKALWPAKSVAAPRAARGTLRATGPALRAASQLPFPKVFPAALQFWCSLRVLGRISHTLQVFCHPASQDGAKHPPSSPHSWLQLFPFPACTQHLRAGIFPFQATRTLSPASQPPHHQLPAPRFVPSTGLGVFRVPPLHPEANERCGAGDRKGPSSPCPMSHPVPSHPARR